MSDEKQLAAIGVFASEPPKKWGDDRPIRVRSLNDWAYLVRQISYFDSGKAIDDAAAREVGKMLRRAKNFPNGGDWSQRVNALGAHDRILQIIREELAAAAPK
jgi:hypothetical protein